MGSNIDSETIASFLQGIDMTFLSSNGPSPSHRTTSDELTTHLQRNKLTGDARETRISAYTKKRANFSRAELETYREKEKLRRRNQRQQLKIEIQGLRQDARILTLQLDHLKHTRDKQLRTRPQLQLWRAYAALKYEERLRSEMEQKRLVAMAQTQATYIDNIRGFISHETIANAVDVSVDSNGSSLHAPLEPLDAAIFRSLIKKIDSCYGQIDDLRRESGLASLHTGVVDLIHRRDVDGDVECIQHLNKFAHSYEFETTHNNSWKVSNLQNRQEDRKDFTEFGSGENTIVVKYRLTRKMATGNSISVLQRYVARRFIEKTRVVIIWKTYLEGEGICQGMHSDETGWCILQPSDSMEGTHQEICIRQVPVLFNSCEAVANSFYRLLQDRLDEDGCAIMDALQNLLLETDMGTTV